MLSVRWEILRGPVGTALAAVQGDRLCWLGFTDLGEDLAVDRFRRDWGDAQPVRGFHPLMAEALAVEPPPDLPVVLRGTDFQKAVWNILHTLPRGTVTTYGAIARTLGRPQAARAVGNAVGANPVSWIIPCHRVGHSNGSLRGFGWGEACKRRLLALEGFTDRKA